MVPLSAACALASVWIGPVGTGLQRTLDPVVTGEPTDSSCTRHPSQVTATGVAICGCWPHCRSNVRTAPPRGLELIGLEGFTPGCHGSPNAHPPLPPADVRERSVFSRIWTSPACAQRARAACPRDRDSSASAVVDLGDLYLWESTCTVGLKQTISVQLALVAERPGTFVVQFTSGGSGGSDPAGGVTVVRAWRTPPASRSRAWPRPRAASPAATSAPGGRIRPRPAGPA
jgi:hypothetical protein